MKIHASGITKHGEIDYEAVVKLSDGFSGADLRNVCTEAGRKLYLFIIGSIYITGIRDGIFTWCWETPKVIGILKGRKRYKIVAVFQACLQSVPSVSM